MTINFVKFEAQGNDYIYFEKDGLKDGDLPTLAVNMSDRHKGVGSDGIIVLEKTAKGINFQIFNSDGSEGKICGNGLRSAGVYAVKYMGAKPSVRFFTRSGERSVEVMAEKEKKVAIANMGKPKLFVSSEFFAEKLQETDLSVNERDVFAVDAGNPHAVFFSGLPLAFARKHALFTEIFKDGVNVECGAVTKDGIRAEVYERGSGKTLSCGSGAVAVAYSAVLSGRAKKGEFIKILMAGGTLEVKIDGEAFLKGEVKEVFKGEYEI